MNYHEWAEKKGRRSSTASAARPSATAFDVVEIDGMLVTEEPIIDGYPLWSGIPRPKQGDASPRDREPANDRHGWHCPCVACRIDRGED